MTVLRSAGGMRLLHGVLCGVAAVLARCALQPLVGNQVPFLVAYPAAMIAAALWGWPAGAVCALVPALTLGSGQLPPHLAPQGLPLQVGGFLVGSVLMAMFCGRAAERGSGRLVDDQFETPLSRWLRAVLWGAFLLPVTVFVLVAWWGYHRTLAEAEDTVTHAADLAYQHAQRALQIAENMARRADQATLGDEAAVRAHEEAIHQRFADIITSVPSVLNLNAWDADGRPLVRGDTFPADPAVRIDDRAYFQAHRSDPQRPFDISEVIRGRLTGSEIATATMRRSSSDGSFRGVITVAMAPSYFRDYYQALTREQHNLASFALVRLDGEVIARWPPLPGGTGHVPPASRTLAQIEAGQDRGVVDVPERADREARIAAFRRLERYPLYVVAGVSRHAMFSDWARFAGLLAAVLLPASGGLVYVTWVALKKTRREAATAAELQEQIRRRAGAEQTLLHSQKLETLAVVTGGVAHDFNNLLAIVNASLHVIKRQHPELAGEKHMQAMSRAIQSGVRLTRQLLSFARKQALKPETVELQTWLPAADGLIRSTLGPNITWVSRVEPETRPVSVDIGELELALINLVVNARHAMPGSGTLTVHAGNVERGGGGPPMVAIAVTDTGTGIAPHVLGKVFEPFFTTRPKGAGSGLGLSQVQGFCAQAGGEARIVSALGHGTTVTMLLPAAPHVATAAVAEPAPVTRLAGRVLLVEDNEDVATTTELVLRSAGLDVVRRPHAAAALAYIEALQTLPDAVLSDIAMPGAMDGIGLAFALRARFPGLPVLLTTGYTEQLEPALAGGLRVLPKPVAPEELLAELAGMLKAAALAATQGLAPAAARR